MSKKHVTLRMKSDMEYESINHSGNKVEIDMYDSEHKKAQSPMELLLSALGGCSAVDAVLMMKKKRRTVSDFFIEIIGNRHEGIPKYYTQIDMKFVLVSPDATEEEFSKVVTLAVEKYCSVASSLKSDIRHISEVRRPE